MVQNDKKCNHHCEEQNCNHECNHGHHECGSCKKNIVTCPVCHFKGLKVPTQTVESLTQMTEIGENYFICTNPKCQTVYFNGEYIYNKCDISTKVWYKSTMQEFIVCYCHKITLIDVITAVRNLGGQASKEEILKYLNKDISKKDCIHRNPVGDNCDKLFDNAIEFAEQVYKNSKGE